jgi:tetratricopeptide (TPR) repeat protein
MDYIFKGYYEDADSEFLNIVREASHSSEPDAEEWKAKALYQAGRVEHLYLGQPRRAVARLREALKLTPNADFSFEARKEIAFIFYDRLRDYRNAALEFERLVKLKTDKKGIEEYLYRIAQCYFMIREFNQARTEAKLLLDNYNEGHIVSKTMLLVANSYYVEGRYQEAVDAHKKLLENNPEREIAARSLFEQGMSYQELKKFELAEKSYLSALKWHPRPDLVQFQISVLKEQIEEEGDEEKKQLPYATASQKYVPNVSEERIRIPSASAKKETKKASIKQPKAKPAPKVENKKNEPKKTAPKAAPPAEAPPKEAIKEPAPQEPPPKKPSVKKDDTKQEVKSKEAEAGAK